MTDDELAIRVHLIVRRMGSMPPCGGILLHLEDFRELVTSMKQNRDQRRNRQTARFFMRGRGKSLYFQTQGETILVKPVLAGLEKGAIALLVP